MGERAAGAFDAILFDLDGTLLRVEMTEFIPRYVEGLAEYCRDYAKPKTFARAMLGSIRDLLKNAGDGVQTNEARVCSYLHRELALPEAALQETFRQFAANHLDSLAEMVKPIPLARMILQQCLQQHVPLVLATNPVFPEFMIKARLCWGGLDDVPFKFLTSLENSHYCKPQAGYFLDILEHLGVAPERCLMVGNDVEQDMAASAVGMKTFLVDTWLAGGRVAAAVYDSRGDHGQLQKFLQEQFEVV